jgi:tetratricopeptide (TPR) repeat protein
MPFGSIRGLHGHNNRAPGLASAGESPRAITDFTTAITLDPNYASAFYNRGLAYERNGDYAHAAGDYDDLIRLQPANPEAWNARCRVRATVDQQLREALADCNESLRLAPDIADTISNRGFVYLKLGDFDKSIVEYDAALRLHPELATAFHGRSLAKRKIGDGAGAEADFLAARAIDQGVAEEFVKRGIK